MLIADMAMVEIDIWPKIPGSRCVWDIAISKGPRPMRAESLQYRVVRTVQKVLGIVFLHGCEKELFWKLG